MGNRHLDTQLEASLAEPDKDVTKLRTVWIQALINKKLNKNRLQLFDLRLGMKSFFFFLH